MALGPTRLQPGSVPPAPEERVALAQLRGGEHSIFTAMHDGLAYEAPEKLFLGGLFPREDTTIVHSEKTRYREEGLVHNTVMSAWLERQRGSRHVELLTQVLENVGAWMPVGEPLVRARTAKGGRVAIEGFEPEIFENLSIGFQSLAIIKTQHTLGFLSLNYDVLDGAPEAS